LRFLLQKADFGDIIKLNNQIFSGENENEKHQGYHNGKDALAFLRGISAKKMGQLRKRA
jgi:hypothetical protein